MKTKLISVAMGVAFAFVAAVVGYDLYQHLMAHLQKLLAGG